MARRLQISLRTAIALPVAVLFIATVVLHSLSQHRQIDYLIQQESAHLLDAITTTANNRLNGFLDPPFQVQRILGDTIARNRLYRDNDMRLVQDYLRSSFKTLHSHREQISLLSFGGRNGEYVGIRREGDRYRLILKDRSTQDQMNVHRDDTTELVTASFPDYDPRVRPWYVPVANTWEARWSPIYTTAGERGDVTISAASPVIEDGVLAGVVEADVRLDALSRFLREEPLRGHGHILIADADGRLVAHSDQEPVLSDQKTEDGQRGRLSVTHSANPVVRAAATHLFSPVDTEGTTFQTWYDNERYFGRITPYVDPRGIDWRIVVLLPESDLLGDARSVSRRTILAASGIAVLALLLSLWIVQRVARPILLTAEAANRIARGEWSADIEAQGALRETSILVQAFNGMAARLRLSFGQMREQLLNDSLTQLLTRRGLVEKADWTTARPAVLCMVGLDAFRSINDSVGYGIGDRLLRAVADRLRERTSAPVMLARMGGDEFAVLHLDGSAQSHDASGKGVLAVFATPFSVGADEVMLNASVGVVGGALRGDELTEWLRNASIALGEAKRHGRNQCVEFETDMVEQSMERARLATELRQALEKDQFLVHYQPVVDLATGHVSGAEALLRWNHPSRGMVPPSVFIPIAEESDLILELGDWVLREATQAIAQALPQLPPHFDIHVNVSARQLIQSDFPTTLQQVLRQSGLPPQRLTLELTESLLIEGDGVTQMRLATIRALGVRIAIDDFGTGYSSLAYLSRLPFDCLKVDQSFVRTLLQSPQDASIVTAVLHMAQGFGVTVVAEGVETEAQAKRLRAMGCASAQGYWLGRPGPLADMDLQDRPELRA